MCRPGALGYYYFMTEQAPHTPPAPEPTTGGAAIEPTPTTPDSPTTKTNPGKPVDPLRHSRTSGAWVAAVGLGLLLVLLVIFIAQNTQTVEVQFLGFEGTTPLAVALLIAAAGGILLTALAGSMRILQLRRRVRRDKKAAS